MAVIRAVTTVIVKFTVVKKYVTAALLKKGKVLPYSLLSVEPGDDPSIQAVSPQVTYSLSLIHI